MAKQTAKIDEFTATMIPDLDNIQNLDKWQRLSELLISKIERKLNLNEVFLTNSGIGVNHFPAGYTNGKFYGDKYISLAYNLTSPRMGLVIKFSASGLTDYLRNYHLKFGSDYQVPDMARIFNNFAEELSLTFRFTRIDTTVDFYDYDLSVNDIYRQLDSQQLDLRDYRGFHKRLNLNSVVNNGVANTIYIGNRGQGSQAFLRIYNKKLEVMSSQNSSEYNTAKELNDWVRFELVNKGKRAHSLTKQLLDLEDNVALSSWIYQLISDKYRFYDINKGQYHMITQEMIKAVSSKVDTLKSDTPIANDVDKQKDYFFSSNAGFQSLLYKIRQLEGIAEMNAYLNELIEFQLNNYEPNKSTRDFVSRKIREKETFSNIKESSSDDEPPI